MYLKTQKLHELKKHMKRFWILKIIEKFSLVGVVGVNAIWIMNIIASVQGIVAPLFIIMTWVFHWSCEVLIRGQQLIYQKGC